VIFERVALFPFFVSLHPTYFTNTHTLSRLLSYLPDQTYLPLSVCFYLVSRFPFFSLSFGNFEGFFPSFRFVTCFSRLGPLSFVPVSLMYVILRFGFPCLQQQCSEDRRSKAKKEENERRVRFRFEKGLQRSKMDRRSREEV